MTGEEAGSSAPLRVLWLIKGLGAGGAEQLLVTQARCSSSDIEPTIAITRPDRAHLVEAAQSAGATVVDLTRASQSPGAWVWSLRRLIVDEDFDLMHVHSPALAPIARVLGRWFGIPVVYTEHNRWAQYRLPTRLANAITYRLDSYQFAVSAGVRASVARPFRRRVEVLHHGIDLDRRPDPGTRERIRSALGLDADQVCVLVVANLRREKAPLDFVDAVARLSTGVPVVCIWAGQGPLEHDFEEAISARGLQDRLRFLGYREDVRDLMAAADIFCLSSHHEGLPVAVMEAMAAGLPIVATAVGGLPEVVEGAEPCGLLVEPGRPELLASALETIVEDPARRLRLARASLVSAKRFDATRAVERIETVYREVC